MKIWSSKEEFGLLKEKQCPHKDTDRCQDVSWQQACKLSTNTWGKKKKGVKTLKETKMYKMFFLFFS